MTAAVPAVATVALVVGLVTAGGAGPGKPAHPPSTPKVAVSLRPVVRTGAVDVQHVIQPSRSTGLEVVAVSPDGQRAVLADRPPATAMAEDLAGWQRTRLGILTLRTGDLRWVPVTTGVKGGVVFSPDGRQVAAQTGGGVELIDTTGAGHRHVPLGLPEHQFPPASIGWLSPHRLVAWSDTTLLTYDPTTSATTRVPLEIPDQSFKDAVLTASPDGRYLAVVSGDQVTQVEAATGHKVGVLAGKPGQSKAVTVLGWADQTHIVTTENVPYQNGSKATRIATATLGQGPQTLYDYRLIGEMFVLTRR